MSEFAYDYVVARDERRESQPSQDEVGCSNCGGLPVGEGCYHLCHNSPHYYSPEQERLDDAHYGEDDHRERYAAELRDLELEAEYDALIPVTDIPVDLGDFGPVNRSAYADYQTDDIPF